MDSRRSSTGQSSNAQSAIDPTRLKSSWESDVTVLLTIQKLHSLNLNAKTEQWIIHDSYYMSYIWIIPFLKITLNVGGTRFLTTKATLKKDSKSFLSRLASCDDINQEMLLKIIFYIVYVDYM